MTPPTPPPDTASGTPNDALTISKHQPSTLIERLVERLRTEAPIAGPLLIEAADAIERLRAAGQAEWESHKETRRILDKSDSENASLRIERDNFEAAARYCSSHHSTEPMPQTLAANTLLKAENASLRARLSSTERVVEAALAERNIRSNATWHQLMDALAALDQSVTPTGGDVQDSAEVRNGGADE